MANFMEKEYSNGKMEVFMKVSIKMDSGMGQVSSLFRIRHWRGFGLMGS